MLQTMLHATMSARRAFRLTGRESEVVELLCAGLAPKEIAGRLDLSYSTVRSHLQSARRRTKSTTTAHLVARFASRRSRSIERASA